MLTIKRFFEIFLVKHQEILYQSLRIKNQVPYIFFPTKQVSQTGSRYSHFQVLIIQGTSQMFNILLQSDAFAVHYSDENKEGKYFWARS